MLPVFGVWVLAMFHLMFVRFWLLSGHLFFKELPTRLAVCSLYILSNCNFSHFLFWFWEWDSDLIAPVPVHGFLSTFISLTEIKFWLNQSTYFGVTCPSVTNISHFLKVTNSGHIWLKRVLVAIISSSQLPYCVIRVNTHFFMIILMHPVFKVPKMRNMSTVIWAAS